MEQVQEKKRIIYIDLLRILASLSVIILHYSSQNWYGYDVKSARWLIYNGYDAIFRFGVPVFVMISGSLFAVSSVRTDFSLKKLYTHNIARLAVIYIIWSSVYGIWDCYLNQTWNIGDIAIEIITGRYHLWFVPMLIGIYMILPFLRLLFQKDDQKLTEYLLVLFFLFQIGKTTIMALRPVYGIEVLVKLMEPELACSYVGYFILGYYLNRFPIKESMKRGLYFLGILSAIGVIGVSTFLSMRWGDPAYEIYDSFALPTCIISAALFVFFQSEVSKIHFSDTVSRVIKNISLDTLGIYLIHILLIEIFEIFHITTNGFPALMGIPFLSVLNFLIATLIISILRRIPKIGKHIC